VNNEQDVSMVSESSDKQWRQRLASHRKEILKEMNLVDQLDVRDPQQVAEFANDIYWGMRDMEKSYMVSPDYLQQVQKELKDTSRAFLVEWLIDVHRKFRLMAETLYVTVSIVDRFLAAHEIRKSQLHIVGVSAVLIATKYEEIYPPELKDLIQIAENKFTKAEVLTMETTVLSALHFDFMAPSSYRFLERFRKLSASAGDERVFFFAQYINEICLLDISLIKHLPSHVAAASLIIALKKMKGFNCWTKQMEQSTGIKEADLRGTVEDVKSFVNEVNPKFLETLRYKFSKPEYFEVAKLPLNL